MNKKILIASLFATLMLLVPMTSVAGVMSKNVTMDNQPPNPPRISGPTRGKVGVAYAFTFTSTDPDGDNVSYYVDWDDGTSYGWTDYVESGQDLWISHTWTKKGIYVIRCKANDTHGAESDWGEYYGFRVRENKTVTYVTVDNQPSVDDCGCQVVNRYDLFRVKLLMFRLKIITNILLLRFGHIPEVAEKCQEILDTINSDSLWDFTIICGMLEQIWNQSSYMHKIICDLYEEYENNPIILGILACFQITLDTIRGSVVILGTSFGCDWVPFP
jgi:hypothetical protein